MKPLPLRRLGAGFVLMTSLALSAGVTGILVFNARRATVDEVGTAFGLASAYMEEFRGRIGSSEHAMREATALARQFDQLRHVHAKVLAPDGTEIEPLTHHDTDEAAPDWFLWLVSGPALRTSIYITHYPNVLGTFVLESDYRSEAAEVWSDLRSVLGAIVAMCVVAVAATFAALHVVRHELASCTRALRAIGAGDFDRPVPRQRLAEIEELAAGIRHLAAELDRQSSGNRMLQQRLVTLSDSERREVASELHDGFGPVLFALRTAVADAEAEGRKSTALADGPLRQELAAIARHVASMQVMLRSIIYRLRPMIDATQPVDEILMEFASAFRELYPQLRLELDSEALEGRCCAESAGLAILRFVQESALNAVRHGGARRILIRAVPAQGGLRVVLSDDGAGPSADAVMGYGLSGMIDRAEALDARFSPPTRMGEMTSTWLLLPAALVGPPTGRKAA